MKAKKQKGYVPYKFKCKEVHIDPRTGLVSEFNAKVKGDGLMARAK